MSNTKKLWLVIYWYWWSAVSRGVINTRQLHLITKQVRFWLRTSRFHDLISLRNWCSLDEIDQHRASFRHSEVLIMKYYKISRLARVQRWCGTDKTTRQFNCLCLQVSKAGFRLQRESESHTTSYHRLHCAENNDGNWKWTIKSALLSGFEGDFYGFNLKILSVN